MILLLLTLVIVAVLVATLYVCRVVDSGRVEETAFFWLTIANLIILFIIL